MSADDAVFPGAHGVTLSGLAPLVTFTAAPLSIRVGDTTTLTWAVINATSVTIDQEIGAVVSASSLVVSPRTTTTYRLAATGTGGSANASVTVEVLPDPSDILWRHSSGQNYLWMMNGTQRIGEAQLATVSPDWQLAGAGDYNGDGHTDILWRHSSGTNYLWLMNGTQRIGEGHLAPVDPAWQLVGAGDYNGDGRADILWRHTSGANYLWLMNGTARIGEGHLAPVDPTWQVAGAADYNGDGRTDILWRHTSGAHYLWLMNGTARIGEGHLPTVDPAWQLGGTGDYDGDGHADMLWRHSSGMNYLWLMNGTQRIGEGHLATVDPAWQLAGTGDYNGDGHADILWRHSSGQNYMWLMNGTQRIGEGHLAPVDPAWQVVSWGTGWVAPRFTTLDGTPPSVTLTAPAAGASVSGTIAVAANASDNLGVVGVQFKLDGANLGAEDIAPPYSISWDTAGVTYGTHTLTAVARDASGNSATAPAVTVTVNGGVLVLSPEDTSLNINANNYSADPLLTTYTWPDNRLANAILMKFDLSSVPPNAVVQEARLFLSLTATDALPATTYSIAASRVLTRNPVIALATGYTADGVTGWTPNSCCHDGVPMAQSDVSTAYDTLQVDKAPGFKSWNLTTMLQEWLADPSANFGVLLGSDLSKSSDHYRYFASMENPNASLRPYLRVLYSISNGAAPVVSAVTTTGVTQSAATINWTTNLAATSQVEYGLTTTYGSMTAIGGTPVTAHSMTLSGLSDGKQYHYRVRSRDQAGNLAISGDRTFTTLDGTFPVASVTTPAAGVTVSSTVSVTATSSDNVGVVGVQFKLDGANLGTEDTTAPYSVSWNTASTSNGSHTLTAVARDAAGNSATSTAVPVTVSNTAPPPSGLWPNEPSGFTVIEETGWESGSLGAWYRIHQAADKPINVGSITNSLLGESKTLQLDFPAGHVGGGGTELRYDIASQDRRNEIYVAYYVQVNPQWQGHNSGINKMVYLHDGGAQFAAMWYEMFGSDSSPLDLYVVNQSGSGPSGMHENVNEITFTRGQWHRVEIYQKQGASQNGIVRVWVDGVLAINRSDVGTRSTPVDNVTISGIWGGIGDTKNQADYMRFDRIRISRPGS